MNDLLQKFSSAEKIRKGFKRRERSKIGKDCQHTWKDLSLTTSRERLIVSCMAAIKVTKITDFLSEDPITSSVTGSTIMLASLSYRLTSV